MLYVDELIRCQKGRYEVESLNAIDAWIAYKQPNGTGACKNA